LPAGRAQAHDDDHDDDDVHFDLDVHRDLDWLGQPRSRRVA
jgi:hypothetical protein